MRFRGRRSPGIVVVAVALAMALTSAACSSGSDGSDGAGDNGSKDAARSSTTQTSSPSRAVLGDVEVRARATFDGKPLAAEFVGAAIRDDHLVTPCQAEIPRARRGRFSIIVRSSDHGAGCGDRGAEILLWTFVNDERFWALEPVPWPKGDLAEAEVEFSSARPLGDTHPVREYFGSVTLADGSPAPTDTLVEAYVGDTLCAVASTRTAGDDFDGYTMTLVGPADIAGCDTTVLPVFKVDGENAATSRPPTPTIRDPLDLTVNP